MASQVYRNFAYNDSMMGQTRTALHYAAFRGELVTMYYLIKEGQNVNRKTVDGVTPLHEACSKGHFHCVKFLLAHGADVNAPNIDGSTPLCDACVSGNVDCIKLLLSHGADVNPPLLRTTPLHEAAIRGNTDAVAFLLESGANMDAYDGHFGTALHAACFGNHLDSARTLLNAGASVNATKLHESSLHIAASGNNAHLIQLLIDHGANTKQRNNRGQLPEDLAAPGSEAVKVLKQYESNPMSLAALCRLQLLRFMKPGEARLLHAIGFPKSLVNYLLHLS